jgi:hypothetical protein
VRRVRRRVAVRRVRSRVITKKVVNKPVFKRQNRRIADLKKRLAKASPA